MNKILFISISAVIIVGLFMLAFWLVGSNGKTATTNSSSGQNVGLPVAGPAGQSATTTITQGTTILVAIVGGGTMQVSDFINNSATVKDPINSDYYYLGYHMYEGVPDSTVTDNPPYIIEYISSTQYFNIALLQEPIGTAREEAQQYLMTRLGVAQNQMCQLNYMVSVPWRVNAQYTGRNLGFSFCPGATVLPQ